jgi:hydrogenase large subunit
MARGFEALLTGKDPRDAPYVTSRFCGVCFSVHQMAGVAALDDAYGADVPDGGRILRNLLMGAEYLYDHVIHFYHLTALDYIDVMAIANYGGNDKDLMAVKEKVVAMVKSGDTAPLTPRYEPDQFTVNDPELVTMAVKHYLDALKIQVTAKNMGAVLGGGRVPHYQGLIVGGVTQIPTPEQLGRFQSMLKEVTSFVRNVYQNDVLTFGTSGWLWPLAELGVGGGHHKYLSYGAFPEADGSQYFKSGYVRDLGAHLGGQAPEAFDEKLVTEHVKNAWYKDASPLHPHDGEQVFDRDKGGAYSFVKAPRYDGESVEVGPLARMVLEANPTLLSLVKKGAKPGAVARHAARMIETVALCDAMERWFGELVAAMGKPGFKIHSGDWDPPATGQGAGFYEAPRGALGHWIKIKDHKIENYQAVVPSTWNASPRDDNGVRGQYEEALIGAPVPDPENPINLVRIIRSFDPCLACAIHVIHPETNEVLKFQVA